VIMEKHVRKRDRPVIGERERGTGNGTSRPGKPTGR
jgi:hypothetical protein